jgi:hypothetical protein
MDSSLGNTKQELWVNIEKMPQCKKRKPTKTNEKAGEKKMVSKK